MQVIERRIWKSWQRFSASGPRCWQSMQCVGTHFGSWMLTLTQRRFIRRTSFVVTSNEFYVVHRCSKFVRVIIDRCVQYWKHLFSLIAFSLSTTEHLLFVVVGNLNETLNRKHRKRLPNRKYMFVQCKPLVFASQIFLQWMDACLHASFLSTLQKQVSTRFCKTRNRLLYFVDLVTCSNPVLILLGLFWILLNNLLKLFYYLKIIG